MAKRKKSSTPHKHHAKRRSTKGNPGKRRAASRRRVARRSNPGAMAGVGGFMSAAAWAIAGAVGSKYLTQAVLGASNTGYLGYGSNLIAAFVMGKGVGMFVKNKQAENAVILGGVIQTLLRWAIDQTPIGSRLSAIGMGDYQATTIFSPVRYKDPLKSAEVDLPSSIQPRLTGAEMQARAAAGGAGAGMAGFARDTYSAKNSTY